MELHAFRDRKYIYREKRKLGQYMGGAGREVGAKPKGRTHLRGVSVPEGVEPKETGKAGEEDLCLLL